MKLDANQVQGLAAAARRLPDEDLAAYMLTRFVGAVPTIAAFKAKFEGEAKSRKAKATVVAKPSKSSKPKPTKSRAKGQKRDPKALAALTEKLGQYIAKNPGLGVEKLAAGMGVPTKDLTLPLKKLLADKALKTTGQRRGTKYFPKGKANGAAEAVN